MTELECLQKLDDIWWYLFNNPSKSKEDAYRELGLVRDRNLCPCCEYAFQKSGNCRKMCGFCPLLDFWPSGGCTRDGSPYMKWQDSDDPEVRANAAAEISCTANMRFFDIKNK